LRHSQPKEIPAQFSAPKMLEKKKDAVKKNFLKKTKGNSL
jgi:hypothetical protein